MDELTETPSETSQPSLLNLDWLLISTGVGVLSILPTFIALIISPAKLAPRLSGKRPAGQLHHLGPGQFFVLSMIVFVLIGSLLRRDRGETEVNPSLAESEQYNAGQSVGRGMRAFIETTGERLASGDIWSAALIAFPIFAYTVALSFVIALLMGALAKFQSLKRQPETPSSVWTIRHSMGAALYMVGSLCLWNTLLLAFGVGMSRGDAPVMVAGLIFLCLILTALVTVGSQAYAFAKAGGIEEGSGLFFAASFVPIAVIGLLTIWIMIAI